MNETPPLPPPYSEPPRPPKPPPFWLMFAVGIGLAVISGMVCAATRGTAAFGLGFLVAVVSLFFQGYRGIFIGFITVVGVAVLTVAVICGSMLAGTNFH